MVSSSKPDSKSHSKSHSKSSTTKPNFRSLLALAAKESMSHQPEGGQVPPRNDDESSNETGIPQVSTDTSTKPSESKHSQTLRRDKRSVSSVHPSNNNNRQEGIHREANLDCLRISAEDKNAEELERPQKDDPHKPTLVPEPDPAYPGVRLSDPDTYLHLEIMLGRIESKLCCEMARSKPFQDALKIDREHCSGQECTKHRTELELPRMFSDVRILDPKRIKNPDLLKMKYWQLGPWGLKAKAGKFANLGNVLPTSDPQKDSQRQGPEMGSQEEDLEEEDSCLLSTGSGFRWLTGFKLSYVDWLVAADSGIEKWVLFDGMKVTKTIHLLSSLFHRMVPYGPHDPAKEMFESEYVDCCWYPPTVDVAPYKQNTNPVAVPLLSEFIDHIACLHKSCFILSPSHDLGCTPSSQTYEHWQITFMTPYLFSRTADRLAGLSHTSEEDLKRIGIELSKPVHASFLVKWGADGRLQRLYCIPMQAGAFTGCWLCFLAEPAMENLWGDLKRHPIWSRAEYFQPPKEPWGTSVF